MSHSQNVFVYTTPFCHPCEALKTWLSTHGVPFKERDPMMEPDVAEHLESHGISSTPALEVDGTLHTGQDLEPARLRLLFPSADGV